MKRWLPWLLVAFTFFHCTALAWPSHDEGLEQFAFGIQHPASSLAATHADHHTCNHSCHGLAHAVGIIVVLRVLVPATSIRDTTAYESDNIPLPPSPPPTRPPDIA